MVNSVICLRERENGMERISWRKRTYMSFGEERSFIEANWVGVYIRVDINYPHSLFATIYKNESKKTSQPL
jgi:hypothetical protein